MLSAMEDIAFLPFELCDWSVNLCSAALASYAGGMFPEGLWIVHLHTTWAQHPAMPRRRYHSPSHPLRLVSGEAGVGRVRVIVDSKRDWPNADFEIGYAVWHEVITASCNVMPARPTGAPGAAGSGEDLRGTFCLNVSPPAPECAPVRRLVCRKLRTHACTFNV